MPTLYCSLIIAFFMFLVVAVWFEHRHEEKWKAAIRARYSQLHMPYDFEATERRIAELQELMNKCESATLPWGVWIWWIPLEIKELKEEVKSQKNMTAPVGRHTLKSLKNSCTTSISHWVNK